MSEIASGAMCEAKMHYADVVYLHHQKCLWLVKSVSSLFADINFSGTYIVIISSPFV